MRIFPLLLAGLVSGSLVSQGQGLPAGQPDTTRTTATTTTAPPIKAAKPAKRITILPIPVLFYQQETGVG